MRLKIFTAKFCFTLSLMGVVIGSSNANVHTSPSAVKHKSNGFIEGRTLNQILKAQGVMADAKDSINFDVRTHVVQLYGSAVFKRKKVTIKADYIQYNTVKKTGRATGNVFVNAKKYEGSELVF